MSEIVSAIKGEDLVVTLKRKLKIMCGPFRGCVKVLLVGKSTCFGVYLLVPCSCTSVQDLLCDCLNLINGVCMLVRLELFFIKLPRCAVAKVRCLLRQP